MGLWVLLLLMAIGSFATMARNMRTRARKIQQFAIWFLVIAVGMLVLPCNSAGDLPLVAIGVALVAPTFFARYTGIFPPLFYLLLLLASIVRGFLPF